MPPPNEELTRDTVYDLLSSARRRFVLYHLRTQNGTIQLTDLADTLAEWEYGTERSDLSQQERKRMYVSLYQTLVPRLQKAGLVAYDAESGLVRSTSRIYQIDRYLPRHEQPEARWELVYLATVGIALVLLAVASLEIGLLSSVTVPVVTVLVVLLFGGVASVHYVSQRRERTRVPVELVSDNDISV